MTVETTYTGDAQVATLTAKNPATGHQTTRYPCGTLIATTARERFVEDQIHQPESPLAQQLLDTVAADLLGLFGAGGFLGRQRGIGMGRFVAPAISGPLKAVLLRDFREDFVD